MPALDPVKSYVFFSNLTLLLAIRTCLKSVPFNLCLKRSINKLSLAIQYNQSQVQVSISPTCLCTDLTNPNALSLNFYFIKTLMLKFIDYFQLKLHPTLCSMLCASNISINSLLQKMLAKLIPEIEKPYSFCLDQCFSTSVPRRTSVPRNVIRCAAKS